MLFTGFPHQTTVQVPDMLSRCTASMNEALRAWRSCQSSDVDS
jgi:hypothetical protein